MFDVTIAEETSSTEGKAAKAESLVIAGTPKTVKPVETPVSEGILTTVEMQATAVTPTTAGTPEHRVQSQQELQGR